MGNWLPVGAPGSFSRLIPQERGGRGRGRVPGSANLSLPHPPAVHMVASVQARSVNGPAPVQLASLPKADRRRNSQTCFNVCRRVPWGMSWTLDSLLEHLACGRTSNAWF